MGVLIGLYGSAVYMEKNPKFQYFVLSTFQSIFAHSFNSVFRAQVAGIQLLPPAIILQGVCVSPLVPCDSKLKKELVDSENEWLWRVQKLVLKFSLLSWFYNNKKILLSTELHNGSVYSEVVKGFPLIITHLQKLISGGGLGLPIQLYDSALSQINLMIRDKEHDLEILSLINGESCRVGSSLKSRFYIEDGKLLVSGVSVCKDCAGSVVLEQTWINGKIHTTVSSDGSLVVPCLPAEKNQCRFSGSFKDAKGSFTLENKDRSFCFAPFSLVLAQRDLLFLGSITFPLKSILSFFTQDSLGQIDEVEGQVVVNLQGDLTHGISGSVLSNNCGYKNFLIDEARLSFLLKKDALMSAFSFKKGKIGLEGFLERDNNLGNISLMLSNATLLPIQFNQWSIRKEDAVIDLSTTQDSAHNKIVLATYGVTLHQEKTGAQVAIKGNASYVPTGLLSLNGSLNDHTYGFTMQIKPYLMPLSCFYKNKEGKNLLDFTGSSDGSRAVHATIAYEGFEQIIHSFFDYRLLGKGEFCFDGAVDNAGMFGKISVNKTTIKIPETYNVLSDFFSDIRINWFPLSVTLTDLKATFDKGTMSSHVSKFGWDEQYNLQKISVPLEINHCFLNWKESFFALFSGHCSLEKEENKQCSLKGALVLDKSQFKENPLSAQEQRDFTSSMIPTIILGQQELLLNISLNTKDPVVISTPQLETKAHVSLMATNTLQAPQLTGTIKCSGGTISFPYKPLSLLRGVIQFVPGEPYDPLLDIVAQDMIKKYSVRLQVTGSLIDPHINLSSSPALTEEQVATLLFTGSTEESLSLVVPAFIMQNVKDLLFSSRKNILVQSPWLEPFKRIRLVPNFSDQSGRGGFRAGIEFDVNDHLHGVIQKNFSLSEDTRFEVEYIITDDVSVRGVKDERSDLGGEVEMRFSF